ncbi:MAG: 3-deoxy-D-manno-octulosonic acid transferase [Candidatus Omnitrophota bacterium]|jgi:3-deoxy-D-manno-octulosonic-acid transferase
MFIIYDLIAFIFTLIYLPVYLFKGKFHRGFLRRLGFIPKALAFDRPIWIHAVSVGEIMAMRELIKELRVSYPLKKLVISTVTPTGNKVANSLAKEGDFVTYLPLDFSCIVRRVIKRIKPSIFIIAETEIWPNLITALNKSGVSIAILNSRISDASFKGYSAIKYLLKPILNKVNIFCSQSESDGLKLKALGAKPGSIIVTGNMKFDQVPSRSVNPEFYKKRMGLKEGERLIIAGSTHRGEEEILLNIYQSLLKDFPYLRFFLAPRHPERASEVEGLVKNFGFEPLRVSLLSVKAPLEKEVFILDTIGELASFYSAADIVFIGGSLVKKGGQNILEPASAGKPVVFGPYMSNFKDIVQIFLRGNAALQVFNQDGLVKAISGLLNNNTQVEGLVNNAREIILRNQGATKRNISLIRKFIEGTTYGD